MSEALWATATVVGLLAVALVVFGGLLVSLGLAGNLAPRALWAILSLLVAALLLVLAASAAVYKRGHRRENRTATPATVELPHRMDPMERMRQVQA